MVRLQQTLREIRARVQSGHPMASLDRLTSVSSLRIPHQQNRINLSSCWRVQVEAFRERLLHEAQSFASLAPAAGNAA